MKRYSVIVIACFGAAAFMPARAADVPEIPYESVPNALTLPAGMNFGEVSGIAVNSKKHVFVYTRGNTTGPAYGAENAFASSWSVRSSRCWESLATWNIPVCGRNIIFIAPKRLASGVILGKHAVTC